MEFIILTIIIAMLMALAPIAVFSVSNNASSRAKTIRLLSPLSLVFAGLSVVNLSACANNISYDCIAYKTIPVIAGTLAYTMYLGWFEYIWRRKNNQIVWPLSANAQYGIASNIILVISTILTIAFIVVCAVADK